MYCRDQGRKWHIFLITFIALNYVEQQFRSHFCRRHIALFIEHQQFEL
jgi:hypothetical protein